MSTSPLPIDDDSESRSSTEIASGIRNTRERMDSTLDELGQRLNPRSLVNSAMDWFEKDKSPGSGTSAPKQAFRSLSSVVKKNPVPALLIGAGVVWLLANSDEDEETSSNKKSGTSPLARGFDGWEGDVESSAGDSGGEGLLDKVKEKAGEAKEAVSDLIDSAKTKAGAIREAGGEAREKAGQLYDSGQQAVQETGRTIRGKYNEGVDLLKEAVEEYPLAVGAAFAALGALAGVLLPRTNREDRLVGGKSDSLLASVKEKGEELVDKGKALAGEVGDKVLETAKEKGITPETAGAKLTELAGKAGEVIRHAAGEVGEAVKSENSPAREGF